jgi:hypothetical protein
LPCCRAGWQRSICGVQVATLQLVACTSHQSQEGLGQGTDLFPAPQARQRCRCWMLSCALQQCCCPGTLACMPLGASASCMCSELAALLQTLYESSVAFGMRKALQTEAGKGELEMQVESLQEEKKELERQVGDGGGVSRLAMLLWMRYLAACCVSC